jgi:hypothetical protein
MLVIVCCPEISAVWSRRAKTSAENFIFGGEEFAFSKSEEIPRN